MEIRRRPALHEQPVPERRPVNQEPPLPSFTVVNFHSSYAFTNAVQVFAGVDNAFDKAYSPFATFTALGGLPPNFNLTNPRTYSPSPPRTYFAGIRLSF